MTPTEQDKELRERLDIRSRLKGLSIFKLGFGFDTYELIDFILADRKKHELQAYSDGFQRAAKGAFKSQQAAKREAVEEVLDRLEGQGQIVDTRLFKREIVATPHSAIEAERNKLKEAK